MLQISSLQRVRVRVGSHARSVQRRLWSQPLDRLAFIFAIMAAMVCVTAVEGGEVKGLSFYPPFKTFSAKGNYRPRCRNTFEYSLGGDKSAHLM